MPLFCGVEGNLKKIKNLYIGLNGEMKKICEVWADDNGVKRLIYKNTDKKIYYLKIINENVIEGTNTISFDIGRTYEIYLIQPGLAGGDGGENWALYKGGGGGAGAINEVIYFKFICLNNLTKINYNISNFLNYKNINSLEFNDGKNLVNINFKVFEESFAKKGGDAWAFNATPDGGDNARPLSHEIIGNTDILISYKSWDGISQTEHSGHNRGAPAPAPNTEIPYMQPLYIAQAGQDAYFNESEDNLCLGNAGGGGNGGKKGGKGAPGGIIIFEL